MTYEERHVIKTGQTVPRFLNREFQTAALVTQNTSLPVRCAHALYDAIQFAIQREAARILVSPDLTDFFKGTFGGVQG